MTYFPYEDDLYEGYGRYHEAMKNDDVFDAVAPVRAFPCSCRIGNHLVLHYESIPG
jgi:hypothetical protein